MYTLPVLTLIHQGKIASQYGKYLPRLTNYSFAILSHLSPSFCGNANYTTYCPAYKQTLHNILQ